jgi:LysM repeat protein
MKQLRAWNGLDARPVLRPGQKLLITPPLQKTPTPPLTAASDSAN